MRMLRREGVAAHSGEVQRAEDSKGKFGRIMRSGRLSQGRTSTELCEQ